MNGLQAREYLVYFVPDVRTECCDAPVRVDPHGPAFLEMVLALTCANCGKDVGSPGLEDLPDPYWVWP